MAEIVQSLLGETTQQAISERGERAAMQPKVAMTEDEAEATKVLEGSADLTFTLEYEVLPTFELGDFKGLKIERPVAEVAPDEIEQRVTAGGRKRAVLPARRPRSEEPAIGSTSTTRRRPTERCSRPIRPRVVIGSGQFIPGFEDAARRREGRRAEDDRGHVPRRLSGRRISPGKAATFDVTVKEVSEPGEVVLDDEFAKRLGLESIEKLRETIGKQIESEYGRATRQRVKRQMLDQLDTLHSFPLPAEPRRAGVRQHLAPGAARHRAPREVVRGGGHD